jgi:hypothetical protein
MCESGRRILELLRPWSVWGMVIYTGSDIIISTMKQGKEHEKCLDNLLKELEGLGYRIIRPDGKSPDAIVISANGDVKAVKVLGKRYAQGKGRWVCSRTINETKKTYSMFDDVIIRKFKYSKPGTSTNL